MYSSSADLLIYSGSVYTLVPQEQHTVLGDDIEVLVDEEERNEHGECAVCLTKTRDALNLQHHERLVHEFFRCSVQCAQAS